jgi:hypothetical protein
MRSPHAHEPLPVQRAGRDGLLPASAWPASLRPETGPDADTGLPVLLGELTVPTPRALRVRLRVENAAGVPIVLAETAVATGQRLLRFGDLRAVGLEAYAHLGAPRRAEAARRIWTRRAWARLVADEA